VTKIERLNEVRHQLIEKRSSSLGAPHSLSRSEWLKNANVNYFQAIVALNISGNM